MKAILAIRAIAVVLTAASLTAQADVGLTLTQTSAKCTVIGPLGGVPRDTPEVIDCPPGPEFDVINNSTRGGPVVTFIDLTYAFTYSDDGLALPTPITLATGDYGGQATSASKQPLVVDFESATLDVDVVSSFGPNPAGPGYVITAVAADTPPGSTSLLGGYLMFGLNDQPDSFSGSFTVTIGVTPYGFQDLARVTSVSVAPSVAAIPEPATYALLLCGMGLLVLRDWRAARPKHFGSSTKS